MSESMNGLITSQKAILHKVIKINPAHVLLEEASVGNARVSDFSFLASPYMCSDLWIRLLGVTNNTCSLQIIQEIEREGKSVVKSLDMKII